MDRKYPLLILLFVIFLVIGAKSSAAQNGSYEFIPAPDLWYNDVDGIRVGLRVKGQMAGTFEDGPHRLDAGLWLSTWFPDTPVSYYLSYTNPIHTWSDFGSEASYQLVSSIRTGYHIHGAALNKRWQQGFDERKYREVRLFQSLEKRFDHEYTAFPALWSDQAKLLSSLSGELKDENRFGWYKVDASLNVQYLNEFYSQFAGSIVQNIEFHEYWGLKLRLFTGVASTGTDPEYLFSRSGMPAIQTLGNGVTRAKGTIPQPWMESGHFQLAGGANLRGYNSQDVDTFYSTDPNVIMTPSLWNSMSTFNAEFDYFNPIAYGFEHLPYAGEFLSFRSYLFFDAGRSLELVDYETDSIYADAGAGFSLSLNIPDYLGKPRGFVFRYELPIWLSEPAGEDEFRARHLFSFGAVISF